MTKTAKYYLIVPSAGSPRVAATTRGLRLDEIAFELEIIAPDSWGRVAETKIQVSLPEQIDGIIVRQVSRNPAAEPEGDTYVESSEGIIR